MGILERSLPPSSHAGSPTLTLEGTIERIVFAGGGGDFTVARLKSKRCLTPSPW